MKTNEYHLIYEHDDGSTNVEVLCVRCAAENGCERGDDTFRTDALIPRVVCQRCGDLCAAPEECAHVYVEARNYGVTLGNVECSKCGAFWTRFERVPEESVRRVLGTTLDALKVIAYTTSIRSILAAHDPMALRQVERAIVAAESEGGTK